MLIASSNPDKVKEIRTMVSDLKEYEIISPADFGISHIVEENGNTLEENALIKAKAFHKLFGFPVISDDTGLFTDALNGEPGVYSARYAGSDATYTDNYKKLHLNLKDVSDPDRKANFKCVICYLTGGDEYKFFEGICNGSISRDPKGENGFGYDPVFIPDGFNKTFAELSEEEKNKISHRGNALRNLKEYLING
ncbi:MAG: RdgB/HAM1 family non-canonical purine NTP pyrophosphatase [Ignavibacteria bacterium]|nr:RdgB/HAM1 family non-canonical purine NTP pyrophosphatase [Ignavibacteria bacterium]